MWKGRQIFCRQPTWLVLGQRTSTDPSAFSSQICWEHKLCKWEACLYLSFLAGEAGSCDASPLGCRSATSALCMEDGGSKCKPTSIVIVHCSICWSKRNSGALVILQLLKHLMICHALSLIIFFFVKRAIATAITREKSGYRGQSLTHSHAVTVQKTRAFKLWLSMLIPELFLISLCLSLSPCSYWLFMSYRVL